MDRQENGGNFRAVTVRREKCLSVYSSQSPKQNGKQRQTVVDLLSALFLFICFSLHYSAGSVDALHVSLVPSPVQSGPEERQG